MSKSLRPSLLAAAAALIVLAAAQSASATPVAFTTSGVFGNVPAASGCTGGGTSQLTCAGGRSVTFVGSTFSQEVSGFGAVNSFGGFQYANLAASTAVGPLLPAGITFTLTITQLSPVPGTVTFAGVIGVEPGGSALFNVMRFNSHTASGGGQITYSVADFFIPGVRTIPSAVNAPVPEPATLVLLGTGLAGAVGAARRRRRAR